MPQERRGKRHMKQQEAYALALALRYQLSCAMVSEEAILGNSPVIKKVQEGNPDGSELHKATSAFLRNFPLGSYSSPKVAISPSASMLAICDWHLFRLNNHLC